MTAKRSLTPNFWLCYGGASAALAWAAWPDAGGYFGQYMFAGLLSVSALGGVVRAFADYRLTMRRRVMKARAKTPSTIHGDANFASVICRMAAGAHDLSAPILAGSCGGLPLNIPKGMSLAVEAAPGSGKTSGVVVASIWHAAMNGYGVCVQDVKPELAYLLGEPLEKAGFRVVYNNPSRIPDFPHTNSNPLAGLVEAVQSDEAEAFTLGEALALSLIPDTKNDKNKFFTLNDRGALIFVMIALAVMEPENCYPAQVYRALVDPRRYRELLLLSRESDALGGDLSAMAANLLQKEIDNPEHFESARTGAAHALTSFKPSSHLGLVGGEHVFDPKDLRDESKPPCIVFDLIPSDQIDVYGKANALTQTARLQSLRRHREGRPVLFLIDGATNLPVPGIVKDLELTRSFGITVALFYQSFGSLKRTYGEDQAKAILSSCAEVYFSVSSLERANDLSQRIGDRTLKTNSYSFDENSRPSESVGETGRRLLSPDQILSMPRDQGIMLIPGIRPILFKKTPWFEVSPFKHLAGDNPHERHAKSPRTWFTLKYGRNASELGPPILEGAKKRFAAAFKRERLRNRRPKAKRLVLRDFIWLPTLATCAALIWQAGTPHLLLEYSTRPDTRGQYACVYVGLSGLREQVKATPCRNVALVRFQASEAL